MFRFNISTLHPHPSTIQAYNLDYFPLSNKQIISTVSSNLHTALHNMVLTTQTAWQHSTYTELKDIKHAGAEFM